MTSIRWSRIFLGHTVLTPGMVAVSAVMLAGCGGAGMPAQSQMAAQAQAAAQTRTAVPSTSNEAALNRATALNADVLSRVKGERSTAVQRSQ